MRARTGSVVLNVLLLPDQLPASSWSPLPSPIMVTTSPTSKASDIRVSGSDLSRWRFHKGGVVERFRERPPTGRATRRRDASLDVAPSVPACWGGGGGLHGPGRYFSALSQEHGSIASRPILPVGSRETIHALRAKRTIGVSNSEVQKVSAGACSSSAY